MIYMLLSYVPNVYCILKLVNTCKYLSCQQFYPKLIYHETW